MPFVEPPPQEVGCPIPANTPHAVSVTLPTWEANIGYEEGADWVCSKMGSGYPRFYIHQTIQKLMSYVEETYGRENEICYLFPSSQAAKRCREFVKKFSQSDGLNVRIVRVAIDEKALLSAVFVPSSEAHLGKQYWQHTGEGVSSRFAEYALGNLSVSSSDSINDATGNATADEGKESFVEERFGRNLDLSFAQEAKTALMKRIAQNINASEQDVYLYPTGMTSIFSAFRAVDAFRGGKKSIVYGFPYVDSLQIQKKFGNGVHFYGQGSTEELDQIEQLLENGEQILMLFCEFPSNPLLKTPDLKRIHELSRKYEFPIVCDETIGNFSNVNVLPFCDIVASSLTKVFSGDSNVMGGSLALNSNGPFYTELKNILKGQYEDTFWAEDAIYMERNSRDFTNRSVRINKNAEAVADLFKNDERVKDVFYPKLNPSKVFYDACKNPSGGYGGLLSVVFHKPEDSMKFYDTVVTAKGPSLGTNFTLTSPYAILAHFNELDYVEQFGVSRYLVRISVGLEDQNELLAEFRRGLDSLRA